MTTVLKDFQRTMGVALTHRFEAVKALYDSAPDRAARERVRLEKGAEMLQAPTGVGKTLIAIDVVQRFALGERVVWFWFVPFTGLAEQAKRTFQAEAPAVKLLSLDADRFAESLRPGAVYVLSWQSVAASQARRLFRETRDDGMSIDELIEQARQLGYRIGCVADEAHHGLQRAHEASTFFSTVLKPDYALLMTATPRDEDAVKFSRKTGYELGGPDSWATIARDQGVAARLLKREVKTVRFIARQGADAKLLDFERLALVQATAVHRRIKAKLAEMDTGLTPLLLVQVPNGGDAVDTAEKILVAELGFSENSVRKHTADEPDEHLGAIANDPTVEVLIFKTAIAMGFDAPRAFTLAALRGVRDEGFGVQVVGRIMRVHRLLQGRDDVPDELMAGYVFLANSEDQEGLRDAATLINSLRAQEPLLGQQTVLTIEVGETGSDDEAFAVSTADPEVADDGASGDVKAADALGASTGEHRPVATPSHDEEVRREALVLLRQLAQHGQLDLLRTGGTAGEHAAGGATAGSPAPRDAGATDATEGLVPAATVIADVLLASSAPTRRYGRRATAPQRVKSERLPSLPDDFEETVVALIDFTPVLGDRDRGSTEITQRTEELFAEDETPVDEQVLAQLSPAVIADRAKQVALPFNDVNERQFLRLLEERFRTALRRRGIAVPDDVEDLRRQLDLVLVRNPRLVREAHRRARSSLIEVTDVSLPDALLGPGNLVRSVKNIYGVFPPGLTTDEGKFANILDTDPDVVWWHRNPHNDRSSLVLWAWSGGAHPFFPDFVVAVAGRQHSEGQALVEVKGEHLQEWDKAKAGAQARYHGRSFMVGMRGDADGTFYFMRLNAGQLEVDGVYETSRLRLDV